MKKFISTIIDNHIPQFIHFDYPNFVNFIRCYYEWAEKEGKGYDFIANLPYYMDVDETSLKILEHFCSVYLSPLPNIIYEQNNLSTLIKTIVQHYQAKGSEKSYQFLFRLIENKSVEFYYPSKDMLRISDGKWVSYKSIKIENPPSTISDWVSAEITGRNSGARAIVDFISTYDSTSGRHLAELFLHEVDVINNIDLFEAGEIIDITMINGGTGTATILPATQSFTIVDPGKYYKKGIRIDINSVAGEDYSLIVNATSKGSVEGIDIEYPGTGYAIGDKIIFNSHGFGSGAYGKVTTVNGTGGITGVKLIFGGHDYTSVPAVSVVSQNGQDAILMATVPNIGMIKSVMTRNFGIGYSGSDTFDIPTMVRVNSQFMDFQIGEEITSAHGNGIIESFDTLGGVMAIRITSGSMVIGDVITGQRMGAVAAIYEVSKAQLAMTMGAVCHYDGRYINSDGHISSDKYIQDSYFYQVFSYMVKTFQPREDWIDYIKPVHPSGTIAFGYREIPNKQKTFEFFFGTFGPALDSAELFRFKWLDSNTQIKQYADVVIDDIININTDQRDKTNYCFGSEITIS